MSATTAPRAVPRRPGPIARLQHLLRAEILGVMIRYVSRLRDGMPLASHDRMVASAELLALECRRAAHLSAAAGDAEMQQNHLAEATWFDNRRARLQSGGLYL